MSCSASCYLIYSAQDMVGTMSSGCLHKPSELYAATQAESERIGQ